jgi:hypothetical protein
MNERTRNRVAWVLLVFLSPILALAVWNAVSRYQDRRPSPTAGGQPAAVQPMFLPLPAPEADPAAAGLAPGVAAEQQKLAAGAPVRNPFAGTGAAAPTGQPLAPAAAQPAPAPEQPRGARLTGFVLNKHTGKRMAIVGGEFLAEGDVFQGWKILRIGSDNVVLGNGTNRMTITK